MKNWAFVFYRLYQFELWALGCPNASMLIRLLSTTNDRNKEIRARLMQFIMAKSNEEVQLLRQGIDKAVKKHGKFNSYGSLAQLNRYIKKIMAEVNWKNIPTEITYQVTMPHKSQCHYRIVHNVAYEGKVSFVNTHTRNSDFWYISPIIENPTWLECIILANEEISITNNHNFTNLSDIVTYNNSKLFNEVTLSIFVLRWGY